MNTFCVMRTSVKGLLILAGVLLPVLVYGQEPYPSGHGALQVWDSVAMANVPAWINTWLMIMLAVFACGLLFVYRHIPARWVVGGFIASMLLSGFILPALGFTMLSGLVALVHVVCWTPALYFLFKERAFFNKLSPYSVWAAAITAVICFSFVFDIRDAVIYLSHMLTR